MIILLVKLNNKDIMSKISKTLIIGIFLHGEFHLTNNGELNTDIVPQGIQLTLINAVAPGIPNISTLLCLENVATKISENIKKRKSESDEIAKNLKNMLVQENTTQSNNIIKEHQYLYSKNQTNHVFQKFAHQCCNSYKIKNYKSNDKIPNKLFTKFNDGNVINPDNIPEKYFNKIVLYNLEEKELDLFEMLKLSGLDIEQITLGQMLEFLINIGVQNLIMIDLSCAVFSGKTEFLTERNIRLIRRQMLFN